MAEENLELLQRANAAVNERDLGSFLALIHPDVEAVPRLVAVEGTYRGHTGIRRWWSSLFEAFPDYSVEVVEARHIGDLTVAELRWRGKGAGSGAPFDETIWQVARWRKGKLVWWRVFELRAEAFEAAGLREAR